MYSPGDVVAASLYDLAGVPGWTVPVDVLMLSVSRFAETNAIMLVQDKSPDGACMYARGTITTAPGCRPTIEQPIVTGPAVGRIVLGAVTGDYDSGLEELDDQARADLALYWNTRGDGPLTAAAVPAYDLAIADIQQRRDAVTEAEAHRDQLIRRLIAGGVESKTLVRPGMSKSRIHQIKAAS